MGRQDEIVKERLRKIEELKKQGIDPYPHKFEKKDNIQECIISKQGTKVKTAGRVMGIRSFGKLAFIKLRDSTGEIQLFFIAKEGDTKSEKKIKSLIKYLDIGDIVGVEGKVGKTKTGEISIIVEEISLLSKSIIPIPSEWYGLQDKEERYRKRYIDILMNPEVKKVFDKRGKIIDAIREYLKQREFNEVDTPYLQTVYGGAMAKPFKTHLNELDIDLFLAISPELFLKRLIVGGYDKVFTIARNFRNEGIDRWHNPEFTMMEIYLAYADYNDMMDLFEGIYEYVAKKVNGTTKIKFKGKKIDFKAPWKRMTMREAIKKYAKIDIDKMDANELEKFAKKNNIKYRDKSWGWLVQGIFEEMCKDKIEQPTFILDHPLETTPLCKIHRNSKFCKLIERFEPFCMGTELGNAYSELNNPILQRELLEKQQKSLEKGDEEANPIDEDFLNAIETGMPPTGGLGLGIDRMIMFLTEQESIRDVILFPFMKPEDNKE